MTTNIDATSVNYLISSSEAFKEQSQTSSVDQFLNSSRKGFSDFSKVNPTYQNKVYAQIWISRNKPQGNPEYGRQTFHDTNGHFSTAKEKAEAIDKYLSSVGKKHLSGSGENVRLNARGYNPRPTDLVWTRQGGPYLRCAAPAHQPTPDLDKVWIPTTKDECLKTGIAVAGVGVFAGVVTGVVIVIRALKNCIFK